MRIERTRETKRNLLASNVFYLDRTKKNIFLKFPLSV